MSMGAVKWVCESGYVTVRALRFEDGLCRC